MRGFTGPRRTLGHAGTGCLRGGRALGELAAHRPREAADQSRTQPMPAPTLLPRRAAVRWFCPRPAAQPPRAPSGDAPHSPPARPATPQQTGRASRDAVPPAALLRAGFRDAGEGRKRCLLNWVPVGFIHLLALILPDVCSLLLITGWREGAAGCHHSSLHPCLPTSRACNPTWAPG